MSQNEHILDDEAKAMAPSSRIKYFDMVIDHGKGALLYDADGKEYIDLLASASSANTGHSHPHVVEAIQKQAEKLIHFTPAYYANSTTSSLLQRLADLAPGDFPKKVALGNSGSDANDALIKYARAYTKRPYIISFTGAYHGSTYGSMTLSGVSLGMARQMGPLLPDIVKMPFPDVHKMLDDESEEDFSERLFAQFLEPIENWLPKEEVACVLIEAIQGDGGIVKVPDSYMHLLYDFCQMNGILFAVDEINQGFGRSGKTWAIDHFGIAPDLMTIGKSVASGMPLSALIGRAEIMEALDAPAHVFTTSGNPVCTAAAHATLDVVRDEKLAERSASLGELAEKFFVEEQKKHPDLITGVRMYGLDGGIDIAGKGKADQIIYRLFELGVIMITLRDTILRFQPPLVITEEQLHEAFKRLSQAFEDVAAGKVQIPSQNHIGW
ncbi:MAG: aspartate aminotransferase family protein [Streptococcaceae bacterium]|jgi:4-aminobutyrate aminotransferase|nr:aspartate aminotransferase family protein [Streptococcaceae bacterium]